MREVAIDLGPPIRLPTKTVLPLRWTATGVSGLFPSLDADLAAKMEPRAASPARRLDALRQLTAAGVPADSIEERAAEPGVRWRVGLPPDA
jgi:DNA repair photolyase